MNNTKWVGGLRQGDNDVEPVTFARKSANERSKITLRHVETIHRIKTRLIGDSYARLGEVVWQLLCAVQLSELHETQFDIAAFGERMAMSDAILARIATYLENEGLLRFRESPDQNCSRSLVLTDAGAAKVEQVVEASAKAFSESFIYPTLSVVS